MKVVQLLNPDQDWESTLKGFAAGENRTIIRTRPDLPDSMLLDA